MPGLKPAHTPRLCSYRFHDLAAEFLGLFMSSFDIVSVDGNDRVFGAGAGFAFLAAQAAVLAAHAAGRTSPPAGTGPSWQASSRSPCSPGPIGNAFGALLHNTAVAIVSYFALAGAFSLLMIPALQAAGRWINTGQTYGWVLYGQWAGHGAQITTSSLLWIALPLTLGLIRTLRRDVHRQN